MKDKKAYVREVREIKIEGGETIRQVATEVTMFEKEPPYVKLYLEDIGRLNGLSKSEQKLVNALVFNMGFNNVVPSYKPVKEMIAEKIGVSYNTVDKGIKTLFKKGILVRKARGFYIMDPQLFGRGSWNDVKKIRMIVDYNANGTKTINTEVSKDLDLLV